jgi:hypothetical protein
MVQPQRAFATCCPKQATTTPIQVISSVTPIDSHFTRNWNYPTQWLWPFAHFFLSEVRQIPYKTITRDGSRQCWPDIAKLATGAVARAAWREAAEWCPRCSADPPSPPPAPSFCTYYGVALPHHSQYVHSTRHMPLSCPARGAWREQ